MSFILDALRKSDAERQRAAAPGLADVRYAARQSRRNIWVPILVAVLAANIAFMAVQWFGRDDARETAAPEATASSPPASVSAQPGAESAAAADAMPATDIRPLARETEFGEPELEPPADTDIAAVPMTQDMVEAAPDAASPEPAPATPSRIQPSNDLPTTEQVIGSGAVDIPMLNLDLHVYSEQPANRFVIINARKYKEGGQITEGPTVESITKDGVILTSKGRRFTLSRR